MIIVQLSGGLGNQMFQYAAARRLAEHNSTILKLDVSFFETYKLHRYGLHCFNVREYLATRQEIAYIKRRRLSIVPRLLLLAGKKFGITKASRILKNRKVEIAERYFLFDAEFLVVPNNVYVTGYRQSEKYFGDIKEIIRREFTFRYPQDTISEDISMSILESESVSLHVRRGDYVLDPATSQSHGICSPQYYRQAISVIMRKVTTPHFFVFSDDPIWVRENLKLDFPMTLVTHNGPTRNYEDLRLMSQCKHNIIANSSFSWWAAWLNTNLEKIVVAPSKWMADGSIDTKDLIPDDWVKI